MNNLYKSRIDDGISVFVGMDLHKNFLQVAVMDKRGNVLQNSKIDNDLKHVYLYVKGDLKIPNSYETYA